MIQWQQLDQKFAALSLREKWLITGCGFVAIFSLVFLRLFNL